MVELANTIWADGPTTAPSQPPKAQIRQWGTYVESLVTLAYTNGKVYSSRSALNADLVPGAGTPGLVIGDPTSGFDGLYMKVGATATGSWTQLLDFVPGAQIVHAVDAGAGTPNAIIATTNVAVSSSGSQLVRLDIFEANTAAPVTITFNGGPVLTIKTAAGNNPSVGGLTAGTVLGLVSGSTFRLLSDQASAAIQAAAEAAAASAIASAAAAYQSMVDAAAVSGSGSFTDPDTAFVTSNQTILGDLLRKEIDPVRLGASTSPATNSSTAVLAALTLHRSIPGSKVVLRHIFGIQQAIQILPSDIIEGIGQDICGFQVNGGGSHHGIYGAPETPAHKAQLRKFSVWAKKETVGTGPFDGIRVHNARGLILNEVGAYDGDAICIRLVDCDQASITGPHVGSSTEARYVSDEAWGLFLDGCAHCVVTGGYGYRTGQGFSINADDSYRRSYASVSNVASNELTCTDPLFFTNLATGDEIRLFLPDGVGTVPGGVTENAVYFAIKSGTETTRVIKLAATLADSLAATAIDITSAGSGTTDTTWDGLALFQLDKHPITTSAVADPATDGITVDATFYRSFTTGQYPLYLTTTGTLPGGTDSRVYWAAKIGGSVIKLYDTSAHAITAGATGLVDITDAGTGTLTVRLAKTAVPVRSGNSVNVTPTLYEILRTGDPIIFKSTGGSPPAPLVADTVYYAIRSATYSFVQVATSVANARAGTAITLTDAGSGTQQVVFHSSFGANLSDSIARRPASEDRGNRFLVCRVERHKNHAFNINSGQNNAGIGCVASDLEEISGGVLVARASFQAKHSTGVGTDRNYYQGCHAIRCGIGYQAQETAHSHFDLCIVDEAEYDGFIANSADDMVVTNPVVVRAKRNVFWGSNSPRFQVSNFDVEGHPNNTSVLFNLDSSGNAIIGGGRHMGTFAFVLDIDSSSGSFEILPGFRTRGLPISVVPTTGRYPVNHQSVEIDLSVTGIRCLGINVEGFHVARVRKLCTVATTGAPTVAVGRRDSTGVLAAAAAPPATADLATSTMSPADATWLIAGGKTPAVEVVVAGTGKVMVELSGMPST
ncbi:hypothetical protein NKH82_17940 [Mesorhizobium sp. M0915]|uniref:hypothetical protein n=1 Tax=Mesorhizobium sp. M0915 TaxID=2957027 RepID=UPI00333C40DB